MTLLISKTLAILWIHVTVTKGYDLTIIHTNDVHARVEQFNKYGSTCSPEDATAGKCFGGVARRMTKIKELRDAYPNSLLLDAGDQFLGTIWFTHYKGKEASHFMNLLGYDVMCLGNHEFDDGPEVLAEFLDNVTFPVVSSNTEAAAQTVLQGKFTKSKVVRVNGEDIGVVGYTTEDTAFISNPGSEVMFTDVIVAVTNEVNSLTAQGVNKIIALGHAGFTIDQLVAEINGVDIVVGGHSNTFLYNGEKPSNDDIEGPYPTVLTKTSGKIALLVQDFTMAKYLGFLNVTFDVNGDVTGYSGNPIVLDSSVAEDAAILQEVEKWAVPLKALQNEVLGFSKINLDGSRGNCRVRECLMGNLVTDAIIDYHLGFQHSNTTWAPAAIALWNGGGIRSSINKGVVTRGDVLTTLPFGNQLDLIRITGKNLRDQLTHVISKWNLEDPNGNFLQVSGLRVTYLIDERKVHEVEVRCAECETPSYSPLDEDKEYNVFTSDFMIGGGDGFTYQPIKRERFNSLDSAVLAAYFTKHNPTFTELSGRIKLVTRDDISASPSFTVSSTFIVSLVSIAIAINI